MTTVDLSDLEAAVRLAKDQGKAKIELHLFVVASLLAEYRRLTDGSSQFEKDARAFLRKKNRDRMEIRP